MKTQAEDVRNDVNDLKNILGNVGKQLQDKANQLSQKLGEYQDKVKNLTKENIQGEIDGLTKLKNDISDLIEGLKKGEVGELKTDQGRSFKDVLDNLDKTFTDKQLDKSFQKLDESFLENSSKKTDKISNASLINIKEAVEEKEKEKTDKSVSKNSKEADKVNVDNIKDEVEKEEVTEDDKKLGNLEISGITNFNEEITTNNTERSTMFTAQELQDIVQEIKSGNNNNPKRSVIENQNPENKVVNLAENNKSEKAEELKTENKIENQKEVVESNDVNNQQEGVKNDPKNQLNEIQKEFEEAGLSELKNTLREYVSNHGTTDNEGLYNKTIACITKLEVFKNAIDNLKTEERTPNTLHGIKQDALEAIKGLKNNELVREKDLTKLETLINDLTTGSDDQVSGYEMTVTIGNYKGWYWQRNNYERNINASLKFNGGIVRLALA